MDDFEVKLYLTDGIERSVPLSEVREIITADNHVCEETAEGVCVKVWVDVFTGYTFFGNAKPCYTTPEKIKKLQETLVFGDMEGTRCH